MYSIDQIKTNHNWQKFKIHFQKQTLDTVATSFQPFGAVELPDMVLYNRTTSGITTSKLYLSRMYSFCMLSIFFINSSYNYIQGAL